jgi:hypothetical protein
VDKPFGLLAYASSSSASSYSAFGSSPMYSYRPSKQSSWVSSIVHLACGWYSRLLVEARLERRGFLHHSYAGNTLGGFTKGEQTRSLAHLFQCFVGPSFPWLPHIFIDHAVPVLLTCGAHVLVGAGPTAFFRVSVLRVVDTLGSRGHVRVCAWRPRRTGRANRIGCLYSHPLALAVG